MEGMEPQAPAMPQGMTAFVPVMHKERFSELSGIELGVLDNWIDRGYVPTLKVGRHRLINLVLLMKECAEAGK
ncbi:hypothetical protein EV699_110138 [Plasticicumulans lactativorans]|uniref:DNA-binding protein n=1 Tax=Plasticicumulans lactativorans TaxID=1133106 RepID=A0A4R2L5L0_9GAMM|nr:hypothetical protein [Plasticicumulans lactativorans]TCO81112.1 hypothetical protein EV699_110138 [Plasticicumulans lactativorans]